MLPDQPDPFPPAPKIRTESPEAKKPRDVAGLTFGRGSLLGVSSAQAEKGESGAKGSLGRTTTFGP